MIQYTLPKVCKGKREWFVYFRYWNGEEYIKRTISKVAAEELNRIKDPKEKEIKFNALREAREIWLQMGWNPLTDPEFKLKESILTGQEFNEIKAWSVEKALNHVVATKRMSDKSRFDYKKSVEYFLKAASLLYIDQIQIGQLTRTQIKAVFSKLITDFKLPAKNYNKRLTHIKSLLSELVEWNCFEYNPAFRLKDLPEEQTQKFIPYTLKEKKLIREHLFIKDYHFFVYIITVYFTGLRPSEILSLKIKDFDELNAIFHLQPFSNVIKNKSERWAFVHKNLLKFFVQMQLEKYNPEFYIFSKGFIPGKQKLKTRTATDLWNKYIKVELSINKYMYALRHTAADDLIDAGIPEKNIGDAFGQKSKLMIRRYTQKGVNASLQVVRNSDIDF